MMITIIIVKTVLIQWQVFPAAHSANQLFTIMPGDSRLRANWVPGPADVAGGSHGLWGIPPFRRMGEATLAPAALSRSWEVMAKHFTKLLGP